MTDKRVVDAVSVTADHVVCPCGALIELESDPDPPPVLPVGDMVYLPRLMAIDCPKCTAEVRLDRFFTDFLPRANKDVSGDLMTARLVNLTTEIGQLIVKSKPVLNAAFYLFLFTTLN
jgi:hypothetical protein